MTYFGIKNGGEVIDERTRQALLSGGLDFARRAQVNLESAQSVGSVILANTELFVHDQQPGGFYHVSPLDTTEAEAFGD